MVFERLSLSVCGLSLVGFFGSVAVATAGCAAHDPRRFPLAAPVTRDHDLDPVRVDCRREKDKKGVAKVVCAPETYESSFVWDAADNSVFRPISKVFQVDAYGEAENVNAFDEVPDSSWFTNRIGVRALSPAEAARGYCAEGPELVSSPPPGSWTIDYGKDNGANPGFRVDVDGTKFMFKTDDDVIERATGATAIASRLYYAMGYFSACDAVVYFNRAALKLTPGLRVKANVGPSRPFDEAMLGRTLAKTGRRGDMYRATASRWLPGRMLGPFTYEGRRADDPSDVIVHENRRDLRGARVIAAWLNHFDSREQNSMATWLPVDPKDPASAGHVRHWYIDLGDSFGSEWVVDDFSRRNGFSYSFDVAHIVGDFATLGVVERPWDRAKRTPGAEIFGYFSVRDFDPDTWHGEYPNPSFGRMTERDAAWATRILARFTDAHVEAAVRVGDFTEPRHTRFLTDVLVERRNILLRRYFSKLSPVTDVAVEGSFVCAVDLARRTKTYPVERFVYSATVTRGTGEPFALPVTVRDEGRICIPLAPRDYPATVPLDAPARYVVLSVANGASRGALVVHLYDLGANGLRVVGLERPE